MELTGGCLCGAVRYRFSGEPKRQFVCHCRDCQRSGGSAFHFGISVPRAGFAITSGRLQKYERKADSGRSITRSFCPVCGSGVCNELDLRPDDVVIKAGTLDDPTLVAPTYEVYARSRLNWTGLAGLTSFPEMYAANFRPKGG